LSLPLRSSPPFHVERLASSCRAGWPPLATSPARGRDSSLEHFPCPRCPRPGALSTQRAAASPSREETGAAGGSGQGRLRRPCRQALAGDGISSRRGPERRWCARRARHSVRTAHSRAPPPGTSESGAAPRSAWLGAAPAGRPQRAGGTAGRRWGGAARTCRLNFLSSPFCVSPPPSMNVYLSSNTIIHPRTLYIIVYG